MDVRRGKTKDTENERPYRAPQQRVWSEKLERPIVVSVALTQIQERKRIESEERPSWAESRAAILRNSSWWHVSLASRRVSA